MPEPQSSRKEPQPASPGMVVTHLQSTEQQVGGHVIAALQQPGSVAVLTTVIPRPDGQSIVSVALDEQTLGQVQDLLANSPNVEELPRVPCVGFHCFLNPNQSDDGDDEETAQRDFP